MHAWRGVRPGRAQDRVATTDDHVINVTMEPHGVGVAWGCVSCGCAGVESRNPGEAVSKSSPSQEYLSGLYEMDSIPVPNASRVTSHRSAPKLGGLVATRNAWSESLRASLG